VPAAQADPSGNRGRGGQDAGGWLYKDPEGNVHGPFGAAKVLKWVDGGYFAGNLEVRASVPACASRCMHRTARASEAAAPLRDRCSLCRPASRHGVSGDNGRRPIDAMQCNTPWPDADATTFMHLIKE
jgi:GYF domain